MNDNRDCFVKTRSKGNTIVTFHLVEKLFSSYRKLRQRNGTYHSKVAIGICERVRSARRSANEKCVRNEICEEPPNHAKRDTWIQDDFQNLAFPGHREAPKPCHRGFIIPGASRRGVPFATEFPLKDSRYPQGVVVTSVGECVGIRGGET